MPVVVNKDMCLSCGACIAQCPAEALAFGADDKAECNPDVCLDCGACVDTCPVSAITQE